MISLPRMTFQSLGIYDADFFRFAVLSMKAQDITLLWRLASIVLSDRFDLGSWIHPRDRGQDLGRGIVALCQQQQHIVVRSVKKEVVCPLGFEASWTLHKIRMGSVGYSKSDGVGTPRGVRLASTLVDGSSLEGSHLFGGRAGLYRVHRALSYLIFPLIHTNNKIA